MFMRNLKFFLKVLYAANDVVNCDRNCHHTISHQYVFSFFYFTLIQRWLIPLAARLYTIISPLPLDHSILQSLLFVPLYPSYSHVSPDNFHDSGGGGGGDGTRLPKSKRNEEYEVKWGEKRSNKAKARECVLLRDKKKSRRTKWRKKKKTRNNRQMKKNSCKSHTHNAYTHTRNTNVLSKFILRIAFLTSVWKYINKKKVSRAGARVCSRVHIIHILYIIVISVRRRWLAASASPWRCSRIFLHFLFEIRSLRRDFFNRL